jgi:hypothetical protein
MKLEIDLSDVNVHIHFDQREAPRWAQTLREMVSQALANQEPTMLDTSKLLESARKQSTENASLRALIVSVKDQLTITKAELAAAIANNDPVATAAAQKDIDDTVTLLDADDAATADAIAENVTPTPAP